MEACEAAIIIEALKKGKLYVKSLPYTDVEGFARIAYDAARGIFVEEYLNRSLYERGEEHFFTERTEEQMMEMFVKERYTDRKYPLHENDEAYILADPRDQVKTWPKPVIEISAMHPNDIGMVRCDACRSRDVVPIQYSYNINPATGDRHIELGLVCKTCGRISHRSWDD